MANIPTMIHTTAATGIPTIVPGLSAAEELVEGGRVEAVGCMVIICSFSG
jgi:hypothetical protein